MYIFNGDRRSFLDIVRSDADRKARAYEALNFYDDIQDPETARLIRHRFSTPESFRIFQVNLTKKIVNRRATAYQIPPTRTFIGWDQEAGLKLYQDINIDAVMKRATKLTKLLKTTTLQVRHTAHGLHVGVLTPHILDAVFTDPERPDRIIVTHEDTNLSRTTYSDWTATTDVTP